MIHDVMCEAQPKNHQEKSALTRLGRGWTTVLVATGGAAGHADRWHGSGMILMQGGRCSGDRCTASDIEHDNTTQKLEKKKTTKERGSNKQ